MTKLKYNDIYHEIRALGLTQQQVADILEININTLHHRVKKDTPSIHWIVYGLSNYFGKKNLIIEDESN